MKKKSGFIFVETIIVIAVLTTALLLLYSTFTGILNQEKRRAAYDDIAYIYRTYYLMEFYSDVAQRNLSLGIDEENYMVSIPLVASNATDLIPEEEKSFYEQLMASTFSATNVYFANGDLSKYEACSEEGSSEVSCDILNDLAGNGWKGYFKTLGDTTENAYIIAVYGVNENGKGGNQCFRIGNDEVTADETECKFYYASIKLDTTLKKPDLHCGTTDLITGEGPVLNNGLIPVVYENNKWVKADTTKKWYDYCEQWWANAVTVKESVRSNYTNAPAGTEIPMSAINTMWVWIPRYEYRIDNLGNQYAGGTKSLPGAIDINFILNDTVTPSSENYTIHPAFIFGTQKLSGIWVAKFEASTDVYCKNLPSRPGDACDQISFNPVIKPNEFSWTSARYGTYFTAIKNNMNGSNGTTTYGITNSDTHMIKNIDWGAVTYLTQSKYGKYGNSDYSGANKQVYSNHSYGSKRGAISIVGCNARISSSEDETITGCSSGNPTPYSSMLYGYDVPLYGTGASTTGTVYGIYDMAGGFMDFVMGVAKEPTNTEVSVGRFTGSNSGFSGKLSNGQDYVGPYEYLRNIDSKYYDVYDYSVSKLDGEVNRYMDGKKGDATYETKGWYNSFTSPVAGWGDENSGDPWIARGGYFQGINGIFDVRLFCGSTGPWGATRPVLVSSMSY